jgi:hypothetical protein
LEVKKKLRKRRGGYDRNDGHYGNGMKNPKSRYK